MGLLRAVLVAAAAINIADRLSLPYNGLIAGLGIGGLAFAFAARETLSNVFGAAILVADRPFKAGDLISAGDVRGTVEHVGIRSTRIRSDEDTTLVSERQARRRHDQQLGRAPLSARDDQARDLRADGRREGRRVSRRGPRSRRRHARRRAGAQKESLRFPARGTGAPGDLRPDLRRRAAGLEVKNRIVSAILALAQTMDVRLGASEAAARSA